MVVRPSRQPGFDNSRFVSGVIVHDDMNVETLGNAHVDLLQEVQELRSSMTLVAFADHKAGSDIEGCEQRRCGHKSESGAPGRPASSAGQAARDQGLETG